VHIDEKSNDCQQVYNSEDNQSIKEEGRGIVWYCFDYSGI